ncbi:urease subunit gamma [Propionimicrobium sp. PCR01-08-3]|uniref:urease subunit gamma n=1 Tax=Propionimicrobium sp. PCR01-08-3 TaxID=3052086 RepID=UPI00255CE1EF|nr:urease subunit gamma [Propionimicrobium sp. PCR01-08-3]WIY81955.1 urease subunit gamma [Propionimicrobium sp. PCR01-08-3]
MHLTPGDQERLMLALAGMVARDRRDRGVKLNQPEAVALLTSWIIERARDGASVAELMQSGRTVLTQDDVMPGVAELLTEVQVEAMFPDGRKLVTVHHPVAATTTGEGPGAIRVRPGTVEINADRSPAERIELVITNTGDRPVQIGSHLHLPDANSALDFDRAKAFGFRLDIPAGTSHRFEPGVSRTVQAVTIRGNRRVPGLQIGKTDGGGLGESTGHAEEA